MRSVITCAAIGALSLIVSAGAGAAGRAVQPSQPTVPATHGAQPTTLGPSHTGQPNKSCEDTPNTPGKSATAPGSAFNPDGHAGTVYAGEQPQNSRNTASVSQYDVACARPTR
ncbi:hypothetical protein [Piscinibacter sp.]|jgi:hypothetical protein|uniref:hypothetical protein n=1 Tax=Piscinibacter sp. TaxID=1903157 RepID=UPI002F3F21CF